MFLSPRMTDGEVKQARLRHESRRLGSGGSCGVAEPPEGTGTVVPDGEHLSSQDASVSATTINSACLKLTGQAWAPAGKSSSAPH